MTIASLPVSPSPKAQVYPLSGRSNVPSPDDVTEAVPAFLTLAIMPLTFSITDGIAFGFISYAGLKLVRGRGKEVSGLVYLFSVLFLGLYAVRSLYAGAPTP